MAEIKIYKPGQFITANGKLFRVVKPKIRRLGVCHLCALATEKQERPGCLCRKYCYRIHSTYSHGTFVQYYLKRVKK